MGVEGINVFVLLAAVIFAGLAVLNSCE